MPILEPERLLKADNGAPIKILDHLGYEGGKEVYSVDFEGEKKILKWYLAQEDTGDILYEDLRRKVKDGAPDKSFRWFKAVTEKTDGSFGYVIDPIPSGYAYLYDLLSRKKVQLCSFKILVDVCIRLVTAFRVLHNRGLVYGEILNDGDVLFNPQTGEVLLCGCDLFVPSGTSMMIMGTARYMAPELLIQQHLGNGITLNSQTERYSLAVLLFLILFMNHPLEGQRAFVPCLTPDVAERLYGTEALFVFDPTDRSNALVKNIHATAIARWELMPDYVKDAFIKAFSRQALKEPSKRLRELDWLNVLVRLRNDIVQCECGNEVFVKDLSEVHCGNCGKQLAFRIMKLSDYSIAAVKGSRIYRCQLGTFSPDDALSPVARVVAKNDDPSILGLQNMTAEVFRVTTPSGNVREVQPKEIMPLKSGLVIAVFGSKIEIQ